MSYFLSLFVAIPLFFLEPQLIAQYLHGGVSVKIEGLADKVKRCTRGGLEYRFVFDSKVCEKNSFWLDECRTFPSTITNVTFDPIGQTFRVTKFLSADATSNQTLAPVSQFQKFEEAFSASTMFEAIPASALGTKVKGKMYYGGVKVAGACKGEFSQTLAELTDYISLGLLELSKEEIGWVEVAIVGE